MSEQPPVVAPSAEKPYYMERCLDCGAALHGRFCAECGQRARRPRPTVRELASEAWQEFVNLDGKVATTLRLLVTRPGRLTVDALAGRRTRYVGAVRLYLLCSLAYFAGSSIIDDRVDGRDRRSPTYAASARSRAERAANPPSCRSTATGFKSFTDAIDCKLERNPDRSDTLMNDNVPRAMFLLLPVFAAILALAFPRHAYVEHLYFALHLHAFAFIAILLAEASFLTSTQADDRWIQPIAFGWLAAYGLLAMRRVYARSWLGTIARGVAAGVVYLIVFMLALLALFVLVAMTM